MNREAIIRELRATNPLGPGRLASLQLGAAEAALGAELFAEPAAESGISALQSRFEPQRPRRGLLALASVTAVAAVAAILLLAGGAESPSRAYGANTADFADATPLLLLEAPGWRVGSSGESQDGEGTVEFVTDGPAAEPSARERTITLAWSDARLSKLLKLSFNDWVPGRELTTIVPALGTMVYVETTADSTRDHAGPADRKMVAIWREDGRLLELRAAVPDLAAFRERLGWLRRVDAQTWLGATRRTPSKQ